jgi:alkyl hydroperoxide reductase subunit F
MPEVTVYSTKNCPYCRMAKALLDRLGIPYRSIDVGEDPKAAAEMIGLSGQRGVPVITVDKEVIIGFDTQRLNELFGKELKVEIFDVLIIGAGPAGLTAAVYCARKFLSCIIVSENIGGQALESWAIENYMGYRMVTGEDLMQKFEDQVRVHNIHLDLDSVDKITVKDGLFTARTVSDVAYVSKSIILAQGMHPKKLGVPGEERFMGKGLSVCSTCDGPLFRDKVVAVVGGGNSALQTAVEMSSVAKEVHLIVRSTIKADEVYMKAYKAKENIVLHVGTVITGLRGENLLSGITIKDLGTGKESDIALDGVFAEIGWIPNTGMVAGLVDLNEKGEVIVDIDCHTSVPGIFAAGDVSSVKSKQIIIAAGEGAKAAIEVYDYLMRLS